MVDDLNASPEAPEEHAHAGSMLFSMAMESVPREFLGQEYQCERRLAACTPASNLRQHQIRSNNSALARRRQGAADGNVALSFFAAACGE